MRLAVTNQGNIGEFVKHLPGVSFEMKDGNNLSHIMVRGFNSRLYHNATFDAPDGQGAGTLSISSDAPVCAPAGEHQHRPHRGDRSHDLRRRRQLLGRRSSSAAPPLIRSGRSASPPISRSTRRRSIQQTPGPGSGDTYKIRPSFKFTLP